MPLPKAVGRFNRVVTNRITGLLAGRAPLFAIVEHTGRKSGARYRTPVNAFRTQNGFVIALTYGRDVDWVRNVLAAGGATLEHRGKRIEMGDPRVIELADPPPELPRIVRTTLGLLRVTHYLRLSYKVESSARQRQKSIDYGGSLGSP
jgi:deazaflavin-dependent oxidoreductase (nitroreductase family)